VKHEIEKENENRGDAQMTPDMSEEAYSVYLEGRMAQMKEEEGSTWDDKMERVVREACRKAWDQHRDAIGRFGYDTEAWREYVGRREAEFRAFEALADRLSDEMFDKAEVSEQLEQLGRSAQRKGLKH
jgi:hypothetical protein